MSTRAKVPLVLNLSLVLGMGVLAIRQLTRWHGLAFVLGVAVATVYVLWGLWEARTSVRDSRGVSVRSDRWTLEVYALSQGATALTAMLVDAHWPASAQTHLLLGTAFFGGGLALRVSAVRSLGEFYSHRVQVTSAHRIVDSGPYQYLRHPAYSGIFLAHVGLVLVFFNWLSVGLLLSALLPSLVARILVEERTMASLPGYDQFCRTRARLIPLLW
ncbi:MAG TPA: isoprenylcysteine carboxylmethyltransferase family protein [Polyangiaceae bacterium]|nr:isoprenylcysteine carboxylmethyltransferase family protein [Polyangiaceae bacterium]